jgi:hypothetical protein
MPVERSAIVEQLAEIGEADRWWGHPEMRELPDILNSEEKIQAVVTGKLKTRLPRMPQLRSWLMVVTDTRLICVRGGERFGRRQLDIPLKHITTLAHKTWMLRASVTIRTSSQRRHRIVIKQGDALKFIAALSSAVNRLSPAPFMRGALPAPGVEYVLRADLEKVFDRIEMLEDEIDRMQKQVDFMEDLLKRRNIELMPMESADSA